MVGDEKTDTLKEKVKGWIELGGKSSLSYHKKQSLLDNKVMPTSILFRLFFTYLDLLHRLIHGRIIVIFVCTMNQWAHIVIIDVCMHVSP